jgi:hypothetical protein
VATVPIGHGARAHVAPLIGLKQQVWPTAQSVLRTQLVAADPLPVDDPVPLPECPVPLPVVDPVPLSVRALVARPSRFDASTPPSAVAGKSDQPQCAANAPTKNATAILPAPSTSFMPSLAQ